MKLGDSECDYETGYFLTHGQYPPKEDNHCISTPAEYDKERHCEPDPYYCWQGTRIPQWFE